jgi:hypothetical protein
MTRPPCPIRSFCRTRSLGRCPGDGINFGCRGLTERYPEAVARIEAANPLYVQEVDTPEAYAAWIDRSASRRHGHDDSDKPLPSLLRSTSGAA